MLSCCQVPTYPENSLKLKKPLKNICEDSAVFTSDKLSLQKWCFYLTANKTQSRLEMCSNKYLIPSLTDLLYVIDPLCRFCIGTNSISRSGIGHCNKKCCKVVRSELYLKVLYTYRIFYINDITALVPLGHAVMSEHRPGAEERNTELVTFAVNVVSACAICSCGVQMFGRCLPVEVLPSGDSQWATVSARTEQHVATVWVSLQKDFSFCSRHRAKTPACPPPHTLLMVMHTQ